jgi:hypothetical protein
MAAAIVPIVLSALPALQPLIQDAVTWVQNKFGYNNGTDKDKLSAVTSIVVSAAESLFASGKIPDKLTPELAVSFIENTIAQMKAKGLLPSSDPAVAAQIADAAAKTNVTPAVQTSSTLPPGAMILGYVYMMPLLSGAPVGGSSTMPK